MVPACGRQTTQDKKTKPTKRSQQAAAHKNRSNANEQQNHGQSPNEQTRTNRQGSTTTAPAGNKRPNNQAAREQGAKRHNQTRRPGAASTLEGHESLQHTRDTQTNRPTRREEGQARCLKFWVGTPTAQVFTQCERCPHGTAMCQMPQKGTEACTTKGRRS